MPKRLFILTILLFLTLGAADGTADDVGITKARLIQESEKSYVLEADVTRILVWALKAPHLSGPVSGVRVGIC